MNTRELIQLITDLELAIEAYQNDIQSSRNDIYFEECSTYKFHFNFDFYISTNNIDTAIDVIQKNVRNIVGFTKLVTLYDTIIGACDFQYDDDIVRDEYCINLQFIYEV